MFYPIFFRTISLVALTSAIAIPQASHAEDVSTINSISLSPNQEVRGKGFIYLPVQRRNQTSQGQSQTRRRQLYAPIRNDISSYSIQVSIGSPPQSIYLSLDTGSSETWVNPTCTSAFESSSCLAKGIYNSSSSTTSVNLNSPFYIQYRIGAVSGEYWKDDFSLNGAQVQQQQFGVAQQTVNLGSGILGVGLGAGIDTTYPNFIDSLFAQGHTATRAYSLLLGDADSAQGSIIFGGLDRGKYSGILEKTPIIPAQESPDGYPRYWISLTSLSLTLPASTNSSVLTNYPIIPETSPLSVFADSDSTYSYLPTSIFNTLISYFPTATYNPSAGAWNVPCSLQSMSGGMNFQFGSTTITVSFKEWIWSDGVKCWFACVPSDSLSVLGDSFLRSAYVVFDQTNSALLLAQAASCGEQVSPIPAGSNPSIYLEPGLCSPILSTPLSLSSVVSSTRSSTKTSQGSSTGTTVRSTSTTSHKPSLSSALPIPSISISSTAATPSPISSLTAQPTSYTTKTTTTSIAITTAMVKPPVVTITRTKTVTVFWNGRRGMVEA